MTDLEGISGIVDWKQTGRDTNRSGVAYEKACMLLTKDVNAAVEGCLNAGAEKIIVGSSVFSKNKNGINKKSLNNKNLIKNKINYDFLKRLNGKIGKDRIIIAIDSLKEEIVIKGWKESTKIKAEEAIKELEPYCSEFLATYVDKEGMLQGTNTGFFKKLRKLTKNKITAAGGITTLEEVRELEKNNISSALGMAVYSGKLRLEDLLKVW